jgi:hypothetical protein
MWCVSFLFQRETLAHELVYAELCHTGFGGSEMASPSFRPSLCRAFPDAVRLASCESVLTHFYLPHSAWSRTSDLNEGSRCWQEERVETATPPRVSTKHYRGIIHYSPPSCLFKSAQSGHAHVLASSRETRSKRRRGGTLARDATQRDAGPPAKVSSLLP